MSIELVLEKVDAIEAKQAEALEGLKTSVEATVAEKFEAFKTETTETVQALEAKIASAKFANIISSPAKTVREDVNKQVRSALKEFVKSGVTKPDFKLFEDDSQYSAYMAEASALTGGGAGVGGRTAYDPVFHPLRLANPLRGVSRNVSTDGSTYQFRAKVGNAGPAWGYAIQNNGSGTTEATNIWQLTLQDLNVQFPVRTAALDDIDGLESNIVDDMLVEFSQAEALSMVQNNDQGSTSLPYGGSNGLRGLNQYAGANSVYAGGTISTAAFGTSGTGSTSGLHSIATYDQITTNGDVAGAANVTYKDLINFVYSLPQQYWTPSTKFVVNPLFLAQIRGLTDDNGTPVFERMDPLVYDGIVGRLLGFDVVVNKYLDNPSGTTATGSDATSLYPMYFGDWSRGHTIVDRLNMVLRRYDQTAPGFITFYGEKRLCTSVVDPFSIIRYRSTATANVA